MRRFGATSSSTGNSTSLMPDRRPDDRARHLREIDHGRRTAMRAERVWGWATLIGRRRAERRARLLGTLARLGPGGRALELGCGTGTFTRLLSRTGTTLIAIDLSWDLLERVPRPIPDGCHLILADAARLP